MLANGLEGILMWCRSFQDPPDDVPEPAWYSNFNCSAWDRPRRTHPWAGSIRFLVPPCSPGQHLRRSAGFLGDGRTVETALEPQMAVIVAFPDRHFFHCAKFRKDTLSGCRRSAGRPQQSTMKPSSNSRVWKTAGMLQVVSTSGR